MLFLSKCYKSSRPGSVLVTLLRLRNEFQRLGGNAATASRFSTPTAQPKPSSVGIKSIDQASSVGVSAPEATQLSTGTLLSPYPSLSFSLSRPSNADLQRLMADAVRLLNKGTRSHDPLSDLVSSSPQYFMEVGKLLTVASFFRASTTDARVSEGINWVRRHLSQFQTTRQIISVCVPIMNLKDGQKNGHKFIWSYLYEPLLMSLLQDNVSDVSSVAEATAGDQACGEADEDRLLQQNRTAVASVFLLISKFLATPSDSPLAESVLTVVGTGLDESVAQEKVTPLPTPEKPCVLDEADKLLTLLEAAVMNLKRRFHPPSEGGGTQEVGQVVVPTAHSRRSTTSAPPLKLNECTNYLQGSHAMRQFLRSFDAASQGAVSQLARLDACDRMMWPILGDSIASATSNDPSMTAGARSLKPYDVINLLRILTQFDSMHSQMDQPIQVLLAFLPVMVSMSTMGELCAFVQVLSKARGRDSGNSSILGLPPHIGLLLFESIRAKLFLMVESHGAKMWPMECSILLSGLSRLEVSSESDSNVDEGLRTSVENVYIANDVLNLLCVHFTACADQVGVSQLVPFLQGLARLKATHSCCHSGKAVVNTDTDALTERLPVLPTTLEKCADIATKLARNDKLSALEAAQILSLLVRLRFKSSDTFFLSIEKLLSSFFCDDLTEYTSDNHRSVHAVVFDAVDRLIGLLSDPSKKFRDKSNTECLHAHALDCALKLRSRLYNSVLGSLAQAETSKEVIRLLKLLYPSLSTSTTSVRGETNVHHAGSSTTTRATGELDHEVIKFLADGEADEEVVGSMKDFLKRENEEAVRLPTDANIESGMLYQPPPSRHTVDASLEAFVRRIVYVSRECNPHELVELSMAVAQLYRYQGLGKTSAHRALDNLLYRPSSFSLSVVQYKKLLDALRIAKKGETVPLHIMDGFSKSLAAATARNPDSQGRSGTEGGCLEIGMSLSILEIIAVGRTILTSIKQQLSSKYSITKGSNYLTEQQRSERMKIFLDIGVSYIGQCAVAINRFILNTYPGHLSDGVEELIVLGYVLARLYCVLATYHAQSVEIQHKSEVTDEAVDGDVFGYDDGDMRLDYVEARDAMDDRIYTNKRNATMGDEQFLTFQSGIVKVFNALGDALCFFLEQSQLLSVDGDKSFEVRSPKEIYSGSLPGAATSGTRTIEPKKYVMLIQSFGIVGVVHHNLLYSLLPQIQHQVPCMDALELSLLMNHLARSGVCSRRILDCMATEIGKHVAKSEMRQCYAILRSMQRSGFLSKSAFLWPKRVLMLNPNQDIDTLAISRNAKLKSSLDVLARALVERLDSLIAQESQIHDTMHSYSLSDLLGVVHALDFFNDPPQPTFDSYYIISTKKLLVESARFSEKGKKGLSAEDMDMLKVAERIFFSAVMLASCTHLLRRSDHQAVSSRVIALSLKVLGRCRGLGTTKMVLVKRGTKSTARSRVCRTTFAAFVAKLSNEKLVELLHTSRVHWLLYDVKLLPSEFVIMDILLRRLESRRPDKESDCPLSDSLSDMSNMLEQFTRSNVFIPFQGIALRCMWRFARFVDQHVLRSLSQTRMRENGAHLTPRGIVILSCMQNYLACGSRWQNNSCKQRVLGGNKTLLAKLLLPGLRRVLLDSTSSSRSSCYHAYNEEITPLINLQTMKLRHIISLYLTHAILLSSVGEPGNEWSDNLKSEVDLFTSVSSVLISKLEQQSLKINMQSSVDLVLASCLLLNIELFTGATHFNEIQSSTSHAIGSMVRRVLLGASQALSLKLHQHSHNRSRWVLLEIYRLVLGFECVLVRVTLALSCPSSADKISKVTELDLLADTSQTHHREEMFVSGFGTADHRVNVQELCEDMLYRVLMTIALSSRASDKSLLCLGKRREAHLVSSVKACMKASAWRQENGSTTDSRGAQRVAQVIQWIANAEDD
ncbi:unnamed protein product [Phytomonas sp. Hart1]|nr:unnamed protein product [Phytomonas sp. Hart1]|eukprot:CCW66984.1 unnamed protein product [Phytomonas sp. isolate Hart1]